MIPPPFIEVLLPSLKRAGTTVSCSLEDFRQLLYLALTFISVDDDWYRQQYPDVQKAIDEKKVASAGDHYRQTGYWEGRLPFRPEVDERWYLTQYPDVRQAIDRGHIKDVVSHYLASGYKEGRLPRNVPVDQHWYQNTYPKARLRLERGDAVNAAEDFVRFGYKEGLMPFRPYLGRQNDGA